MIDNTKFIFPYIVRYFQPADQEKAMKFLQVNYSTCSVQNSKLKPVLLEFFVDKKLIFMSFIWVNKEYEILFLRGEKGAKRGQILKFCIFGRYTQFLFSSET